MKRFLIAALCLTMLLAACAPQETPSAATKTPTPLPENTSVVTPAPVSSPPATPQASPGKQELYQQAFVMIGEKRYPEAMGILAELGEYGKAKETLEHLRYIVSAPYISAGGWSVAAMTSDGGVIYLNNGADDHLEGSLKWTDMRAICIKSDYFIEGISKSGKISVTPRIDKKDLGAQGAPGPDMVKLVENVEALENIKEYDAMYPQSAVALTNDGEVYAAYPNGESFFGKLPGWTDMVAVCDGRSYAAGLKSDGTVLTALSDHYIGTLDTSNWRDIVAIDADHCLVGLKSDGTCISTGINDRGQGNLSGWTDIIAISTNEGVTLGLKRDGTVVAAGDNQYGQMDIAGWKDIIAIDVGFYISIGLKADGTMVVAGDCSNVNMDLPAVHTLRNLYVPSSLPPLQEVWQQSYAGGGTPRLVSSGDGGALLPKQDGGYGAGFPYVIEWKKDYSVTISMEETGFTAHGMVNKETESHLYNGIPYQCDEDRILAEADVSLLRRAVSNIVINAIIHNAPETEVTVSVSLSDDITISISDNGKGLAEEEIKNLFNRYYRGTNTEEKSQGSDLGLAIAKQIVELHNGSIEVHSVLWKGTDITIHLSKYAE